ncbi:DNA topoisomerase I [hydrothermal vent metagenome]|uniref:DNA topoisomerase n=1 Tax=hydrothermal vent metagenome TaxID=652676 RepID=A0A3B0QQA4_9ZZZZ
MKKALVIVESPAKARTINKYLGRGFKVMASVGHIRDLPKSKLGVDLEDDFKPQYDTIKGKGKVIKELKAASKGVDEIYLAPDPDREGEAIAWHISEVISGRGGIKKGEKKIHRVLFTEITSKGIKKAIANPTTLDINKVNAQQTRRILDRLVGYQVSPILWDKVRRGLSAGRVQSVAVRVICEREREIQAFVKKEYWSIVASFPEFEAKLAKCDKKKLEISSEEEASGILKELKGETFTVAEIKRKERRRNPLPPFITSTMQQEASRKLSFSAKQTMMFAQQLYEGVELGDEGPVGLITYMRTDSPRIADEARDAARAFIAEQYGKEYIPEKPNAYKGKKSAQEAHEAIRPTTMVYTPEIVKPHLSKEQWRLYDLVWKRFVASQMTPAVYDQTSVQINAGRYLFTATGAVMKFPGFIAVYEEGKDEDGDKEKEGTLPHLDEGKDLPLKAITPNQHFTQPPPRFTEATLVKDMEEKGIGRPSTYAAIISTIQDREYVIKDQRRLAPTDLGFLINDLLVESFPNILDAEFTAHMEEELDRIEEGKADWVEVMKKFYGPFKERLATAKKEMKTVKGSETPTDIKCEKCGQEMVVKWGRRGKFLACTGYPECKSTADFITDDEGKIQISEREELTTDEKCPKCEAAMLVKIGRFGRFLACSTYPDCKGTRPFSIGIKCPEEGCKGGLIERRTKRGRTFFGCSNYPKCKYASWDDPKKETAE